MTAAQPVPAAAVAGDPEEALLASDRVELRRTAGVAALARLDRLRRPCGPVVARGGLASFLLAPGTAETVPDLLRWLGWGAELGLGLTARPGCGGAGVPRPRGAGEEPPRPECCVAASSAVWLRHGEAGPGLDLGSPDLLRLLDCLADACARDLLGLAPAA